MSFDMTITARGQFTLNKGAMNHLGIQPGEKVTVSLEPDRTLRIAPATRKLSLDEVLARVSKYDVASASAEELDRLIAEGAKRRAKWCMENMDETPPAFPAPLRLSGDRLSLAEIDAAKKAGRK